ncbi:phage terminase large subunit family protein [Bacillus sp. D-CC]
MGYDPAESGDSAGLVVVAPPEPTYNKFRLLEHHQFKRIHQSTNHHGNFGPS